VADTDVWDSDEVTVDSVDWQPIPAKFTCEKLLLLFDQSAAFLIRKNSAVAKTITVPSGSQMTMEFNRLLIVHGSTLCYVKSSGPTGIISYQQF
jgi:hypothetical protein